MPSSTASISVSAALHLFAKTDTERRLMINSIGRCGTVMKSGWSPAAARCSRRSGSVCHRLFRILPCVRGASGRLIFRAVAIEFAVKTKPGGGASSGTASFCISSVLSSLLIGIALGTSPWGFRSMSDTSSSGHSGPAESVCAAGWSPDRLVVHDARGDLRRHEDRR